MGLKCKMYTYNLYKLYISYYICTFNKIYCKVLLANYTNIRNPTFFFLYISKIQYFMPSDFHFKDAYFKPKNEICRSINTENEKGSI